MAGSQIIQYRVPFVRLVGHHKSDGSHSGFFVISDAPSSSPDQNRLSIYVIVQFFQTSYD